MSAAAQVSRALIRLYPRAWRERYRDELEALLAERGAGWRDVVDLIRGCLSEWVSVAAAPRPGRAGSGAAAGVAWLAALLIGTAAATWLAATLGDVLRVRSGAPAPLWVRLTFGVNACLLLRGGLALCETARGRSFAGRIGTAEAAAWLTLIFVAVLVQNWAGHGLLAGEPYALGTFVWPLHLVMLVWISSRHYAWLAIRQVNLHVLRTVVSDSRLRLEQLERLTRHGLARPESLARARADHVAVKQQFNQTAQRLQASVPKHPLGLGSIVAPASSTQADI